MPRLGGKQAHSRFEAEFEILTRVLGQWGALSHERLWELSGAERWKGPRFDAVLAEAIREGRIRQAGENFYELVEPHEH